MELRKLINALDAPRLAGQEDVDIQDIQSDSRRVGAGSLFVAVRGTAVDGHAYIGSAIEKGAAAIVCEEIPEELYQAVVDIYLYFLNFDPADPEKFRRENKTE